MSIKIMSWVWENGPTSAVERLVLLALADFCDDDGRCWPSMDRIGAKAGVTARGARNIVRRLESEGWIEVELNRGRGHSNRYLVITENRNGASCYVHSQHGSGRPLKSERQTGNDKPGMTNPECGDHKIGTWRPENRNLRSGDPSRTIIDPSEVVVVDARARNPAFPDPTPHEQILAAIGVHDVTAKWHSPAAIAATDRWLEALPLADILAEIAAIMVGRTGPPGSLAYFDPAMCRAVTRKANPPPPLQPAIHGATDARPASPGCRVLPIRKGQSYGERLDDAFNAAAARLAQQPFEP